MLSLICLHSGSGAVRVVIVEYWLAGVFGRVWLRLRPGLRSALGEMPAKATEVARGASLPAVQLERVQDFGVRVWYRFAAVPLFLFVLVVVVAAVARPGPAGTGVAVDFILVLVFVMAVGMVQVIMLRLRANRTAAFVRQRLRLAAGFGESLPAGSAGLPRRSDFWVSSSVAIAFCAVLWYASSSRH
jgi:hypothetical protein